VTLTSGAPPVGDLKRVEEMWAVGELFGPSWEGIGEDHVWFEDRWMVASLCDE
jgi:hypothetical protein